MSARLVIIKHIHRGCRMTTKDNCSLRRVGHVAIRHGPVIPCVINYPLAVLIIVDALCYVHRTRQ